MQLIIFICVSNGLGFSLALRRKGPIAELKTFNFDIQTHLVLDAVAWLMLASLKFDTESIFRHDSASFVCLQQLVNSV